MCGPPNKIKFTCNYKKCFTKINNKIKTKVIYEKTQYSYKKISIIKTKKITVEILRKHKIRIHI